MFGKVVPGKLKNDSVIGIIGETQHLNRLLFFWDPLFFEGKKPNILGPGDLFSFGSRCEVLKVVWSYDLFQVLEAESNALKALKGLLQERRVEGFAVDVATS